MRARLRLHGLILSVLLLPLFSFCRESSGSGAGLFGGGVLYSKSDVAILRTDPTTYGFEIDKIRRGESVKVLDRTEKKVRMRQKEDYWYFVEKDNHVKGWIFGGTLSRIPVPGVDEVVEGPDMVVVQANLPGEWWEVNTDDTTGFRRLKFEPAGQTTAEKTPGKDEKPEKKEAKPKGEDEQKEVVLSDSGKVQYFYGKQAGVTVEYRIDPKTRRIHLMQETPVGQDLELLDLGEDFRLTSARGDKKFAFKKGYDTDEEEKKKKEEEKKNKEEGKKEEGEKPTGR